MFCCFVILLAIHVTNHVVSSGRLGDRCPQDARLELFTTKERQIILNLMNFYRNQGAGGSYANFKDACRMGTVQWNNTLTAIAASRASQCGKYAQSNADNTYIAQSPYRKTFAARANGTNRVHIAFRKWMQQRKYANETTINFCPNTTNSLNRIDDFLHMMTDTNTHVGCAATTYSAKRGNQYNFFLVCAFEKPNKVGHPVYESCVKPAEKCHKKNPIHRNLCDVSEHYELPAFGPSCPPDTRVVHFNPILIQLMLDKINGVRNQTAGGSNANLAPACGMKAMRWSNTLSSRAASRARQCGAHMDNSFFRGHSHGFKNYRGILNLTTAVSDVLDMWKGESNHVDQSMINSYSDTGNSINLSENVLNMLIDSGEEVGCYATTYSAKTPTRFVFLLNCAYGKLNKAGRSVYKSCDSPAKNCGKRNPIYQNLCAESKF